MKCQCATAKGNKCKNKSLANSNFCRLHQKCVGLKAAPPKKVQQMPIKIKPSSATKEEFLQYIVNHIFPLVAETMKKYFKLKIKAQIGVLNDKPTIYLYYTSDPKKPVIRSRLGHLTGLVDELEDKFDSEFFDYGYEIYFEPVTEKDKGDYKEMEDTQVYYLTIKRAKINKPLPAIWHPEEIRNHPSFATMIL